MTTRRDDLLARHRYERIRNLDDGPPYRPPCRINGSRCACEAEWLVPHDGGLTVRCFEVGVDGYPAPRPHF